MSKEDGPKDRRKMTLPPDGVQPAGKWYAVSRGRKVGVFLSW